MVTQVRKDFLTLKALAYAIGVIQYLPVDRQEHSSMREMITLLASLADLQMRAHLAWEVWRHTNSLPDLTTDDDDFDAYCAHVKKPAQFLASGHADDARLKEIVERLGNHILTLGFGRGAPILGPDSTGDTADQKAGGINHGEVVSLMKANRDRKPAAQR